MKFSCNKCDTKYSIADEKVRGKVLKIRCKKCENIIVLREPKAEEPRGEEPTRAMALDPATLAQLRSAMADPGKGPAASQPQPRAGTSPGGAVLRKQAPQETSDSTRVVGLGEIEDVVKRAQQAAPARQSTSGNVALRPAPTPAPMAQAPDWFLAVKGQQIGPLTQAQVQQRMAAGEADDRTYAWRDGMGDWKRIADVPELRGRSMPPPPPPAPPPVPANGGAQVVDLQAEIARRQRRPMAEEPVAQPQRATVGQSTEDDPLAAMMADEPPDGLGMTGSAPLNASSQDPFAAVPDAAAANEGPPRESTRMFIAAAGLENRGRKHMVYGAVGTVLFLCVGGLLTADALGFVTIPFAHDFVNYSFETLGVEQPQARKERIEADDMDMADAFTRKKAAQAKAHGNKRGNNGLNLPGEGVDLAGALNGAAAGGGVTLGERRDDSSGVDVKMSDLTTSQALKDQLGSGHRTIAVTGPKQATPVNNPGTGVKDQVDVPLKPEQIGKVVADQKSSLTQCAQDAAKAGEKYKGNVAVTVTIGPSGKVLKVGVNDPKIANMTLGSCLSRALMRWIFPSFKGEPFDAELPLKMTVGP